MPVFETAPASDSEWEYEYDESQTEDLYFTLDLPPTVEPAPKRRKTNGKTAALNEDAGLADDPPSAQYITNGHTRQHPRDRESQSRPIRLTGLDTTSPSVEYGGQRYDCRWTTDLGTQFHVARPGIVKRPRKAGHAVDVVALTRVRLTGQMTPNVGPTGAVKSSGASTGQAIVLDDDEEADEGGSDEEDDSAKADPPAQGPSQPSFLERVAEVQRRRKERLASGVSDSEAAASMAIDSTTQMHPPITTHTANADAAVAPLTDHDRDSAARANAAAVEERNAAAESDVQDESSAIAGADP